MTATWLVTAATLLASSLAAPPNIIFILSDDQDIALGGFTPMEKTKKLIAEQGVTFENAFVATPVCCPSRSSILTGQYITTHGTINNTEAGGCSSTSWQEHSEPNTYATALHNAGYDTFYTGKYLNQYGHPTAGGPEHVPAGWDWWVGLVGNSVFYNYTLSVNGTAVPRGDADEDYLTDVIKDYALQFLSQPRQNSFLMAINPPAAHNPFTPAKRHKGRFSDIKAPRTPNFNLPSNNTKHWLTRLGPAVLPQETIDLIDIIYRDRWETLLAVDEMVEEIVLKLDDMGVLNNTYIIYTSDHGFHFGQFGLPWDKRQPYEFDIRIPLVVRGPNVVKNASAKAPIVSIDFAPTMIDMAGVDIPDSMEGVSFLPQLNHVDSNFRRIFYIDYFGEASNNSNNSCHPDPNLIYCIEQAACKCFDARNNTYSCVRVLSTSTDELYCMFFEEAAFEEFYDIGSDPNQLFNIAGDISRMQSYRDLLRCVQDKRKVGGRTNTCLTRPLSKELHNVSLLP